MSKVCYLKDSFSDVKTDSYYFHRGDVLDVYRFWPKPDLIISDGAYGVRGFRGDTDSSHDLPDWYRAHIVEWSKYVKPSTTLFSEYGNRMGGCSSDPRGEWLGICADDHMG